MATVLENLTAAREGAAQDLADAFTGDFSAAIRFKPDFNGANSLDRDKWIARLQSLIEWLDKEINRHDVFEVTSEMTA